MKKIESENYLEIIADEGLLLTNKEHDFFKKNIYVPKNYDLSLILEEKNTIDEEKIDIDALNNKINDISKVVLRLKESLDDIVENNEKIFKPIEGSILNLYKDLVEGNFIDIHDVPKDYRDRLKVVN